MVTRCWLPILNPTFMKGNVNLFYYSGRIYDQSCKKGLKRPKKYGKTLL
jgi:hypothetical protein